MSVVRYLATASGHRVRQAIRDGRLGQIVTPRAGNQVEPGAVWAADNGCFSASYPGDAAYLSWLESKSPEERSRCLFAVAPDVVADAAATLTRAGPLMPVIRQIGYPVAFVAQDGLEALPVPWDDFDVLFIGGSTRWKLGPHAAGLVAEARARGKDTHVGRVNSERRYRQFAHLGVDSADGTFLAFCPDHNLPAVEAWIRGHRTQPGLWEAS